MIPAKTAWKIPDGDGERQVKVTDIVDCLRACSSLLTKEIEYNRAIKENPRMKRTYEDHLLITVLLRGKFEDMSDREKEPTPTIPGRKK
jgi:hypothetical protein